jgi:predicted nucleic acid-binding protein
VLLDTGPLVALIVEKERRHDWSAQQFAGIAPPLLTCEAVLAEACHLAGRTAGGRQVVLQLCDRGVVSLAFDLRSHFPEVSALMSRYDDVPMSLADACLVRMSELIADSTVFTIDADFRLYRRHRRQQIPLLIPPDV